MILTWGTEEKCDYRKEYSKYENNQIHPLDRNYDDKTDLISKLIPSKDVRKYHEKIGYKYSPFVIASLISHTEMPFFRVVDELNKLMSGDASLNEQISEYVDYKEFSYKGFVDNENRHFIYKLEAKERIGGEAHCLFVNYSDAREYSLRLKGEKFRILKIKTVMSVDEFEEDDDDLYSNEYGRANYDENGNLITCYLWDVPSPNDDYKCFNRAYIYIPFPFRFGDFVKYSKYELFGMVTEPSNEDDLQKHFIDLPTEPDEFGFAYDYTDFIISVEFLRDEKEEDYDWSHEHISPLELEYADVDLTNPEEGSIEMIMKTLKEIKNGKGFIFELEYEVKKFRLNQENEKNHNKE